MDSRLAFQNFLASTQKEATILQIDWREELLLAIEAGNFSLAYNAWQHSKIEVEKGAMERLLLNALCSGYVLDAYQAAAALSRDLCEDEIMMLTEVAILTGNISGVCMLAGSRQNTIDKAFQDCAMIIATARHIKLKNKQALPPYGVLGSWQNIYAQEIRQLRITGNRVHISQFPSGNFLHVDEKSKQRLFGFLLAHELITQEDALILGV